MKYLLYLLPLMLSVNFVTAQEKNYYKDVYFPHTPWLPYQDASGRWSFRSAENGHLKNLYFDSVTEFVQSPYMAAQVMQNGLWGMIGDNGNWVVPAQYQKLKIAYPLADKGFIQAIKSEKGKETTEYFDFEGNRIDLSRYCCCELSQPDNEGVNHFIDKRISYRNINGSRAIHCWYDEAHKKAEIVSITGKTLLDTAAIRSALYQGWYSGYGFYNERIVFSDHSGYFIDIPRKNTLTYSPAVQTVPTTKGVMLIRNGDTVVPPGIYTNYLPACDYGCYGEPFIRVEQNGRWGMIDSNGKVLIEPKFDNVYFLPGAGAVAQSGDKNILFDSSWNKLDFEGDRRVYWLSDYSDLNIFSSSLGYHQSGVITREGKILVPEVWTSVEVFKAENSYYFFAENIQTKTVAFYNREGKLLFKRKNVIYKEPVMNDCWAVGDEKNICIFNALTGKIISKKVEVRNNEPVTAPIAIFEPYRQKRTYSYIGVYSKRKGWKVIDRQGNVLMPAMPAKYDEVALIVLGDTLWGAIYSETRKSPEYNYQNPYIQSVAQTKTETVFLATEGGLWYSSGLFTSRTDSTYTHYSMHGKALKSGPLTDGSPWLRFTSPDTVYVQTSQLGTNFYDASLRPIFPQDFDAIQFTNYEYDETPYLLAKAGTDGKYRLILYNGKAITASRLYDQLVYSKYYAYGQNGELTDFYDQKGELRFDGCEKFTENKTYFTFEKNRKKYWMDKLGQVYKITEL